MIHMRFSLSSMIQSIPVPKHALTLPGPTLSPKVRAFVEYMAVSGSAPARGRADG